MCVYNSFQSSYKDYLFVFKVGCKKNFVSKFHTILFYVHHSVGKISEYLMVIGDMRSNPARAFVFVTFPRKKIKHIFLDKHCKI